MPEVDVPLFSGVYRNIDDTVANDRSHRLVDGILDDGPSIFSRPGLTSRVQLVEPSGQTFGTIDGLFWWDEKRLYVAVSQGIVWHGATVEAMTPSFGDRLLQGAKPTFAADATNLYIANGTRIVKWNSSISPVYLSDAQAPVNVTHIALLDTYLIANQVGSNTFYYSEVGNPESWLALSFASAESEPDVITSLIKFRGEIYLHGRKTLEIWQDDGQTPFSRVNGGSFDTGCISPYSVVQLDNTIMWLSDKRQFVQFGGGGIERFSSEYDKDIGKFSVVADCIAYRLDVLGKTLAVFQFPSEQKTLVYNATNGNWGEFGLWNSAGGFHEPFLGISHCYVPETGTILLGSRKTDGFIYEMRDTYVTDNGTPINLLLQSGHINYGTNTEKISNSFSLRVKRGYVSDSSEPVARLRFRDDNKAWDNERQFSLGKLGDYFNTFKRHRLGRYRTRQYELRCSDPVGFVFSEAKEEIEATGR